MLTPAAVKAAQPMARAYKLFDAGGLFLFVAPSGLKSWRVKYRRAGKEKLATLGQYPTVSLPEARSMRDGLKQRLKDGGCGEAKITPTTFEQLGRAWHANQTPRWSIAHADDVLACLERDVFPALGKNPAASIDAPMLLELLEAVEARGCLATAKRLRQRLSAIFAFGIARHLCAADPAAILGRAMQPARPPRNHPALVSIEECRVLLAAADRQIAPARVKLASRFLALTAVRLDAVRGMRWNEIEGWGGSEPIWRVPSVRMKLAKVKKGDERFDHVVPLSAQACQVVQDLHDLMRDEGRGLPDSDQLVFSRGAAPMGEGAIRQLYIDAGYRGRHVPHGWRASFSTILNEELRGEGDIIEQALAHTPKDKVKAAYDRAEQMARRRALFDQWGAMLAV
jgi:integrase